ncbi:MAG: hypothetical protein KJO61_00790 [Deltaproteobacteria bacterium]|nr:hypothetical protein [Deltaproteobacteria bacterium]
MHRLPGALPTDPDERNYRIRFLGSDSFDRIRKQPGCTQLAHNCAVPQTIDIYLRPDTHSAEVKVTRFVGSKSLPWVLPAERCARLPLPCSGSLGPQFPTLPVREL